MPTRPTLAKTARLVRSAEPAALATPEGDASTPGITPDGIPGVIDDIGVIPGSTSGTLTEITPADAAGPADAARPADAAGTPEIPGTSAANTDGTVLASSPGSPPAGPRGAGSARTASAGSASSRTPRIDVLPEDASFEQACEFLEARINVERMRPSRVPADVFKLERMRLLMEALGDPQSQLRMVHIAGSKGKGSTCEMVTSCLAECGYTVGLYTSPHLTDIRERIRLGTALISHADFAACLHRVSEAGHRIAQAAGEPTFFELLTAMAFVHFAEQAVDLAVIEVGLGGRLDSTNIITPEVSAVTAIQLEHTQLLGDTLDKIAREKSGIFKPNVPAITVPQKPEVLAAMRDAAHAAGTSLSVLGESIEFTYRFEASPELGPHARVCLSSPRSEFEHLPVPLKGEHQALNCGLALAVLDRLREKGFDTPERKVAVGLSKTPNLGRMELVWTAPRIIVDGAHNPESIEALIKAIGSHIRCDSTVFIFGCAADKDIPGMLAKLARGGDKVIFTRAAGNPRSVDPRELARRFTDISHKMVQVAPSFADAIQMAKRAVGRDDLICVTGSFYLAGEAKAYLRERAKSIGATRGR